MAGGIGAGLVSLTHPKPGAGEVFRTPAGSTGTNAYTPSVAATGPTTSAASVVAAPALPPPAAALAPPSGAPVNSVATFRGGTPGLYGGTRQLSTCDPAQMVSFLAANPQKEAAWASVEGIPTSQVASYISKLTSVVLRVDTRVTNHGFIGGPTTIPEVLQAGTAVLVDQFGVPRARCFCGNPLTPPTAVTGTPSYSGPSWPAFSPAKLAAVVPAPAPLRSLTLVDMHTGTPFVRPVATTGSQDQPAPPNALAGSPFSAAPGAPTTAKAGPPDLTGAWVSPDDPSAPAWQLQETADGQSLRASWRGGDGHTGLVGSFTGTLNPGTSSYAGLMHVTEGATDVTGTMTITAVSPTRISIQYHQANGPGGTITLVRQGSQGGAGVTSTTQPPASTTTAPASTTSSTG